MDAGFEAHLRVGEATFEGRDAALLRAVAAEGSLNAAAEALGRSYSRSHSRVSELEDEAGPLVERRRGGAGGGGSRLTDAARDLLARFERLESALEGTARTEKVVLQGTVASREGDLVTVETPAGTVRALLDREPDRDRDRNRDRDRDRDAERVRVTFRADAVTLHDPDRAPGDASSARNRFAGTVTAVDTSVATATLRVDVGAPTPLVVTITTESLEGLDLAAGQDVVATVKATATRATPVVGGGGEG